MYQFTTDNVDKTYNKCEQLQETFKAVTVKNTFFQTTNTVFSRMLIKQVRSNWKTRMSINCE
jgi:hypothetical protein